MIAPFFQCHSRNGAPHAEHYLQGRLSHLPRKNMERMGEALPTLATKTCNISCPTAPGTPARSGAGWASAPTPIWAGTPTPLLIDESGFAKKGDRSVGVARQ